MFEPVYNLLEKLANDIRNLGNVFVSTYRNTLKEHCYDSIEVPTLTNYQCNKCGCRLSIINHNTNEIFYECIGCGKTYKSSKKRLLGRFKTC